MTNLTINNKNRTIEMTKKFAKAASRYGTEEYNVLQAARKDYPTYQVVTKSSGGKGKGKENHRGLTYEYMKMSLEQRFHGTAWGKVIIKKWPLTQIKRLRW